MSVTLRQMRIFEATARLERLSQAANEQAISQPAASQALKEMERSLGYPLFERRGRHLLLSSEGEQILSRVRQILELTQQLTQPATGSVMGVMHLAASITIASYLAPSLIARFKHVHPQADIKLSIENTSQVLSSVAKGRALLGLIEGPAMHSELLITPWQTDQLVVFSAPEHPLAQLRKPSFKKLLQYPWVVRESGSGTRSILDAELQRLGVKINIAQALNRQEAIKQSVIAGLGVGCLSHLAIARELASGQLVQLPTPLNLERRFSWVLAPERQEQPMLKAFIELCTRSSPQ